MRAAIWADGSLTERVRVGSELYSQIRDEVHGLLNHFMAGRWQEVAPGIAAVTDAGVCYVYNEEVALKAGFGAVSGLQLSPGLVEKLAEVNGLNRLAHAWLKLDRDTGTWSVMFPARTMPAR